MNEGGIKEHPVSNRVIPPQSTPSVCRKPVWPSKSRPQKVERVPQAVPAKHSIKPLSETEQIHLENVRQLKKLSPKEIEDAKAQLAETLNPDVLRSLLRRAELKEAQLDGSNLATLDKASSTGKAANETETKCPSSKHPEVYDKQSSIQEHNVAVGPRPGPKSPPRADASKGSISETHQPYFHGVPIESDKLAWMQPVSEEEEEEYSTSLVSVAPSELRFDFQGNLVTPRRSNSLELHKGLHHHGDAPAAAGYTLAELSHLARSSFPTQRALAIQTCGRILFKLNSGVFKKSNELQEGLKSLVEQTQVIKTLKEAASETTRHQTVRYLAQEALDLCGSESS